MTASEAVQPSRLAFLNLIRRTFLILKDRPLFFFSLGAIAILPSKVLEWLGYEITDTIISSLLATVISGAIAYAVFTSLNEKKLISSGKALPQALSWPLVGYAFVCAVLMLLSLESMDYLIHQLGGGLASGLTGLFLWIVLYLWLYSLFLAFIPACVVEDLGLLASLRRSLELTRGHRSRIFFILAGLCFLFELSVLLLFWGLSIILFDGFFLPSIDGPPTTPAQLGIYVTYSIYNIFLAAFSAVIITIMYCDLRDMEEKPAEKVAEKQKAPGGLKNQRKQIIILLFLLLALSFLIWRGSYDSLKNTPAHNPAKAAAQKAKDKPKLGMLILDFNKNGVVDTKDLSNGTYFDHDGNRFAEKTGWVGSGDAVLVRDLNGNGQIDDGRELFGSNTILGSGQKATSGFQALAELDSNGDGVIDHRDEFWPELRLWRDWNSNGVVDKGEFLPLEKVGIANLNLDHASSTFIDAKGNQHRHVGSFNWSNGTVSQMADVWLKVDLASTHYLDEIEVPAEIKKLPDLPGYGNIPSLHQAMAADKGSRLQPLVEQFVHSDPLTAKTLVWDIMFAWTGVTDLDPASRGPHIGDARKLYALEKCWGSEFISLNSSLQPLPYPHAKDSATLNQVFLEWEQKLTAYLMLKTHYASSYELVRKAMKALARGAETAEALKPLCAAMQASYHHGTEKDRLELYDFLTQLNVYDAMGQTCIKTLKKFYLSQAVQDDFTTFILSQGLTVLAGTLEDDLLTADNKDTWLYGDKGDDRLYGGTGNDRLCGGEGYDYLEGGSGNDTYVFGAGYGYDTVNAYTPDQSNYDTVRLLELTANDVEFHAVSREENGIACRDLVIVIKATGETLTILNGAGTDANYQLKNVEFADGTSVLAQNISR